MDRRSLLQQSCKISRAPLLPLEYREVEYIESTGEQWIDTGAYVNKKTLVKTDYIYLDNSHSYQSIFGVFSDNPYALLARTSSDMWLGNTDYVQADNLINNTRYVGEYNYEVGNAYAKENSIEIFRNDAGTTIYNGEHPLAIFTINEYGSISTKHASSLKLYYFDITQDDILVRSFVPCIRVSDSKPGLYDLINHQFYVNQGTGADFLYGPEVKYGEYEIPYVGTAQLTKAYVQHVAAGLNPYRLASTSRVIVPVGFTSYEAGALDEIFAQFKNMVEIRSPWLNGLVNELEWTVPYISGTTSTTLTASYINGFLQGDSIAFSNLYRIIVPDYFIDIEDGAFAGFPSAVADIRILGCQSVRYIDDLLNGSGITHLDRFDTRLTRTDINAYASIQSSAVLIDEFHIYGVPGCKVVTSNNYYSKCFPTSAHVQRLYVGENINTYHTSFNVNLFSNYAVYGEYPSTFGNFTGDMNFASNAKVWMQSPTSKILWGRVYGAAFVYVPANALIAYITGENNGAGGLWDGWYSKMVGFLDYAGTVPTFSGYTPTWYSDEDCTNVVQTSSFTNGNRYFVKLTAN